MAGTAKNTVADVQNCGGFSWGLHCGNYTLNWAMILEFSENSKLYPAPWSMSAFPLVALRTGEAKHNTG